MFSATSFSATQPESDSLRVETSSRNAYAALSSAAVSLISAEKETTIVKTTATSAMTIVSSTRVKPRLSKTVLLTFFGCLVVCVLNIVYLSFVKWGVGT